jgi:hypothetical protein
MALLLSTLGAWAAPQLEPEEWYAELKVVTPDAKLKDNAVLGQLLDSVEGLDAHDLRELPHQQAPDLGLLPFSSPWLTLVVTDQDPAVLAQPVQLDSNFHGLPGRAVERWYLEVSSDDPHRDLMLRWSLSQNTGQRMRLVDLDRNVSIPAKRPNGSPVYPFNMDGLAKRRFAWVYNRPRP